MHRTRFHGWFLLTASLVGTAAQAAVIHDESVNGDLSNDGLFPSVLALQPGSNVVRGTIGNWESGVDRDYLTFAVAPGQVLSRFSLLPADTFVSGGVSFLAIQGGPQVTVTPSGAGAENLLGWFHYDTSMTGYDLLPTLLFNYAGPLQAGNYSVWIQDTGGPAGYGLELDVAPVPLPGAALLLISGAMGLAGFVRRRRLT